MTARLTMICLSLFVFGCGSGIEEMDTAEVTGKVTLNGTPLTEGQVLFFPTREGSESASAQNSGKSARGEIEPDGTYTLTTYSSGDGAVVGKHRVMVMQSDSQKGDGDRDELGRYTEFVTVEAGKENVIDLDLTPLKKKKGDDDEDDD